jgi:hypothetical protein
VRATSGANLVRPLFLVNLYFLVVVGGTVVQNPRRGCRRVPNGMGS